MTNAISLQIPLLNPNEPEALLADLFVKEGQEVQVGDPLYTLETTKSTAEVTAETTGFIVGLQVESGQTVSAGDLFAYLAPSLDWEPPDIPKTKEEAKETTPENLRITKPALKLANEHQLDLSNLPIGPLVTIKTIQQLLERDQTNKKESSQEDDWDPTAIIVYGGGGHGKSVIDVLRAMGDYKIIGVIDDGVLPGEEILGVPILGGGDQLTTLYSQGVRLAVNAVGGIGSVQTRIKVFKKLEENGFTCPPIIHPSAILEPSAKLSPGTQVFPLAYVGSDVSVGFGSIINTGAIVSHDCNLGNYVNISPGAILAGAVQIEDQSLVGMGVTINLGVQIGEGAKIGNSATVKSDLPPKGIVRAGSVWPKEKKSS